MLFLAFAVGTWLAGRRARREGISPEHLWDVILYVFIGGLIGARIFALFVNPVPGNWWQQFLHFFEIWKGGMVFYGGAIGGILAYVIAYFRIVKPNGLSTLRLADIVAPSIALGICLGRIGCLLNGCCYGDVADPARVSWGIQFPSNSPPHRDLVGHGYQTAYGFFLETEAGRDGRTVREVEPLGPAAAAGLQRGDRIVAVGDVETPSTLELLRQLAIWPQGEPLQLTVARNGQRVVIDFTPPPSLRVHPTQIYSSFDGLMLFFLLTAYYPFRRRPGEVFALLLVLYPINRFFIERLRNDTPATWFGRFTIAQVISLVTVVLALAFWLWLRRPTPKPTEG